MSSLGGGASRLKSHINRKMAMNSTLSKGNDSFMIKTQTCVRDDLDGETPVNLRKKAFNQTFDLSGQNFIATPQKPPKSFAQKISE
jgi:hypothetical protein